MRCALCDRETTALFINLVLGPLCLDCQALQRRCAADLGEPEMDEADHDPA